MKTTSPVQKVIDEVRTAPMWNMSESIGAGLVLDNPLTLWSLSIAGGDICNAILKEVQDTLTKARGHQLNALKTGIERLRQRKLIDEHEAKYMTEICEIVFSVIRRKQTVAEARTTVNNIYHKMLVESTNGSVALVFASIVAHENGPLKNGPFDLTTDSGDGTTAVANISRGTVGGVIAGVIIGSQIGSMTGLPGGAVLGGIIGGGTSTMCDDEDED